MTQHDLIYLAGYVDGDGCLRCGTTIQKCGVVVYELSITITSIKKEVLVHFKERFGGNISTVKAKENHRTAHAWTIKGNAAAQLAKKLIPYLVNKAVESSYFIELSSTIKPNSFKKVSSETISHRNNIISQKRIENHENGLVNNESIKFFKTLKNTIKPTEDDFIYLAGLVDSEGCIRISNRCRYRNGKAERIYNTVLEIGNTKIEMIGWLVKRFGGSLTFIQPKISTRRAVGLWAIHSQALKPILAKIEPFLINKKDVCHEIMNFQQTILPNGGDRHSPAFKKTFERLCLIRHEIIERVHKLNHKGTS